MKERSASSAAAVTSSSAIRRISLTALSICSRESCMRALAASLSSCVVALVMSPRCMITAGIISFTRFAVAAARLAFKSSDAALRALAPCQAVPPTPTTAAMAVATAAQIAAQSVPEMTWIVGDTIPEIMRASLHGRYPKSLLCGHTGNGEYALGQAYVSRSDSAGSGNAPECSAHRFLMALLRLVGQGLQPSPRRCRSRVPVRPAEHRGCEGAHVEVEPYRDRSPVGSSVEHVLEVVVGEACLQVAVEHESTDRAGVRSSAVEQCVRQVTAVTGEVPFREFGNAARVGRDGDAVLVGEDEQLVLHPIGSSCQPRVQLRGVVSVRRHAAERVPSVPDVLDGIHGEPVGAGAPHLVVGIFQKPVESGERFKDEPYIGPSPAAWACRLSPVIVSPNASLASVDIDSTWPRAVMLIGCGNRRLLRL